MASKNIHFLDDYLPYALRRADQALSAPFYDHLSSRGVARSEWRLLAVLFDLGDMSVVELAEASLSPQPTVTHALRRLEDRKLVKRTPGAEDKRQRFVSLTASGTKLTRSLIREAKFFEAQALANTDDLSSLVEQLKDLTAVVQAAADSQTKEHISDVA